MKQEQESVTNGQEQTSAGSDTPESERKLPAGKRDKPASRVKNDYEPYITPPILYEMVRWLLVMPIFHLAGRLHVRGLSNIPASGPFIIASNHLSWTDIPLIAMYIRRRKMIYMAKEEYFKGKLRWVVRFLGAFPVKRGEADRQSLRVSEEQLKKGNILGIFPEGTRSRTRMMAQAHSGMGLIALRTGVPVVPIALWGTENLLKKFGAPVMVCVGEPIVLKPKGKKITRGDIDEATTTIMHTIAEMLPPQYRGVYGE
jgi:1-acyl-sn-glycerol-3-phosphate acyltransferase